MQHRRRFSTGGRIEGTFDVEMIETRIGRAGSIAHTPNSDEIRDSTHVAYTLRPTAKKKESKTPEEKERLKQIKKLETDQESHPIAWAVGRFLFPFEIGFQVQHALPHNGNYSSYVINKNNYPLGVG